MVVCSRIFLGPLRIENFPFKLRFEKNRQVYIILFIPTSVHSGLDITQFKNGSQNFESKEKCIDFMEMMKPNKNVLTMVYKTRGPGGPVSLHWHVYM